MSSTGPIDIAPIIERLQSLDVLQSVESAAEYEAATRSGPARFPCAFVLLGAERASGSKGASGVLVQAAEAVVGVVVCVQNLRKQETGQAAAVDLNPVLQAIRSRLLRWVHPEASAATELISGRVLHLEAGKLWWQDLYRINYRIEVR